MRLNELTIPQYSDQAAHKLRAAGWQMDSTGLNSKVYYRDDKDYVLKLYNSRDYAYEAFLQLVLKHPNKHFPKIIGKPRKVSRAYYAVRMEKLDFVGYGDQLALNLYLYAREFGGSLPHDASRIKVEYFQKVTEYLDKNPEMKKALDLIYDNLLKDFKEDLHAGNIMQRSDGTLVIIDPIS